MLSIYAMPDHLHMLFGYSTNQCTAELRRKVKSESSFWINNEKICPYKFQWQEGYGAFSYSKSQIPVVARYIEQQEEHHKKITFRKEYKSLLDEFGVVYDPKYLFHEPISIMDSSHRR
jgi:putative transposase